ncbi:MAG: MerR family DNA-binding transcriptional regulator [Rhodobacteraceae bacterium]|nr:MerR family DNA-binding transcriptional regulator [Paracoccaceae bacterium]
MTDQVFSIRQMCDRFNVTPRTLRFYEAKELIAPLREGQRRVYSKREAARVHLILLGKKFGFSLEELRQLLDLYYLDDAQQTQLTQTFAMATKRLDALKAQRDELNVAINDLETRIKWGAKMITPQKQQAAE